MYTNIKDELQHYAKIYLTKGISPEKGVRLMDRIAKKYDKEPREVTRRFFNEVYRQEAKNELRK